jgi:hypothetical protein
VFSGRIAGITDDDFYINDDLGESIPGERVHSVGRHLQMWPDRVGPTAPTTPRDSTDMVPSRAPFLPSSVFLTGTIGHDYVDV